jgi:hypothetical protein
MIPNHPVRRRPKTGRVNRTPRYKIKKGKRSKMRKLFVVIICLTLLFHGVFVWSAEPGTKKTKKHKPKTSDLSCPNGIENISKLAMSNPYDNEGRCFEYVGASVQLLSKNKALYSYFFSDTTPAALIDFGKESAPKAYGGLVKGKGAFKYQTVMGNQNIIHNLVAIPKEKEKEEKSVDAK